MWVEEVKGRYKFCDRYKGKKVCVTLDGNTAKYHRRAAEILNEKIKKLKVPAAERITLSELKDLYMEWKRKNYKEQSCISTDFRLKKIMQALGENTLVSDVTPAMYKNIMDDDPEAYNDKLKYFKALINWGYQNDLISVNITDRLPKKKTAPVRIKDADKYLEKDELIALLEDMNEYWKCLTEFLALTGMRIGEVIDLNIEDVDLSNRTIDVNSTFSLITRKSSSVKTDTSYRQIYIQDELIPVIERIQALRKGFPNSKAFFPASRGKLQYDSYRKYLREHSEKVLGRRITPHYLRHTHTALFAEAGIQLPAISRRLGHADSKITEQVYMHITEKTQEKENERMKKVTLLSPDMPPEEK